MTAIVPVLGVLGLCWVSLVNPTHVKAPYCKTSSTPVLGVLGLRTRTRVRATFNSATKAQKKSYANPQKLNKPNTLNTAIGNQLILLSFNCVGFVLGSVNVCWVQFTVRGQ